MSERRPTTCSTSATGSSAGPTTASRSRPSSLRAHDTEVRVLRGRGRVAVVGRDQGVGVRVVRRRPPGLRLRRHARRRRARRDARRGARQRRLRHARRVRRPGRARRRRPSPSSTCSGATPGRVPDRREGRAGPRARAAPRGGRPADLAASSRPTTSTRSREGAVATTTGIRTRSRGAPACYADGVGARRRGRRDPDRVRLLGRAASRPTSTSTRRPTTPAERATRLLGADQAGVAARSRSCSIRGSPPSSSASSAARSSARRC